MPITEDVLLICVFGGLLNGVGSALCLEGIVGTGGDSGLRFLPLDPPLEVGLSLVWKKGGVQGKAQKIFLDEVKGVFASVGRGPTEAV